MDHTRDETARGAVLVVEDDDSMREMLHDRLSSLGYKVTSAASAPAALERLGRADADAVLTDLRMRAVTGLELCRQIGGRNADLPVIVLTAFGDYEAAVEAVRAGAYDFLSKPVKIDVLDMALRRAVTHRRLTQRVKRLEQSQREPQQFPGMIGESRAMQRLFDLMARIADSDATVLITGESGTGKDLVARALHARSTRAGGPFVAINCAALPEPLLESELFGHERGAFTDAKTARRGLFVAADGGSIFLDEIAELPLTLQAKLLRALEARVVRPVGGSEDVGFDARIFAATNRDLELRVEDGSFRRDLWFRLNVIELLVPPLATRENDVLLLAREFLASCATRARKKICGFTAHAAAELLRYRWPGNVRELRNAVERAVALATHDHITAEDLPERIRDRRLGALPLDAFDLVTLEEMEKRHILRVLDASGGSKTLAAKTLGVDRTTLWRKLERYRDRASDLPAHE